MKLKETKVTSKLIYALAAVMSCFMLFVVNMNVSAESLKDFEKADSKASAAQTRSDQIFKNVKQKDAFLYTTGEKGIEVTWDKNTLNGIEGIGVFWSTNSNVPFESDEWQYLAGDQGCDFNTMAFAAPKDINSFYVKMAALVFDSEEEDWVWYEASDALKVVTLPSSIAVSAVQQTDASKTSATVRWGASTGADHYVFTVLSSAGKVVDSGTTKANSITTNKLSAGNDYYFYVNPVCSNGAGFTKNGGGVGKKWIGTMPKDGAGVKNLGYLKKDLLVQFNHDKYSDGYKVRFYNPKKKVTTVTVNGYQSAAILRKAAKNSWYQVSVQPFVKIDTKTVYGKESKKVTCISEASASVPKSKKKFTGSPKVTLKWSKVKNATSYQVFMSTKANKGYKPVAKVNAKKNSVEIKKFKKKNFKFNTRYYYYVKVTGKVNKKTVSSVHKDTRGSYVMFTKK